ncbi:MAG: pyridoxamine 5'-phosphate oxidase family protein [Deltaproteobacteria bacterium]|nr:pyridoxamine 5'-phosphate oxidase family protein [Deltaproteobacteria bacterium]
MTRAALLAFLRGAKLMVEATVAPSGAPQAAVVGFVVTDDLELVFDTDTGARKHTNLAADPRIALVIWEGAITVQLEGVADLPTGDTLERIRAAYLAGFPDGHARAAARPISYLRVRPRWVRYSDLGQEPPRIVELAL